MSVVSYTIPAPSGGINVSSPIDEMDPSEALELINLVPSDIAPVELRSGYTAWRDTQSGARIGFLAGLIDTIAGFAGPIESSRLIGSADNKIWRFSGIPPASNITGATTPTSDDWNTDIFGYRLYMCNGANPVQVWDGSTVADSTFTGATLPNIINVSSYKERLYFIEKNGLGFYYGNVQAIGSSALTAYDLRYVTRLGGKLLFAGSFTNRYALASEDLFFACTSQGEVLFYSGSYPGDAAWTLVARFVIGKPMGYRAFVRVNNDMWVITEQGIISLSALFSQDPKAVMQGFAKRINPIITQYAKAVGFHHMWHGVYYVQGRKVFICVPTASNTTSLLLVYVTDQDAWTVYNLFHAGDAVALGISGGTLYYGSVDGKTYTAETGLNDRGNAISFNSRSAFNHFGSKDRYKTFKDVRPFLRTIQGLTLQLGMDTNYQRLASLDAVPLSPAATSAWGGPWGPPWPASNEYIFDRHSLKGQGHVGALRVAGTSTNAPLQLFGFETRFELGGQV